LISSLTAAISHDETRGLFLDGPRRREVAWRHCAEKGTRTYRAYRF
jgi:hypothetical protein